MSDDVRPEDNEPELDVTESGAAEAAAAASDTFEQASDGEPAAIVEDADAAGMNPPEIDEEIDAIAEPEKPAKLERLQKILAQAGVASRRHAESLITEGRVQVNGKVVTELGTKADAARDHIRVDGKLLQGSERLRYFMLNKPRGFVTTVRDPENRPTVMQFFTKLRERLYPVGRLDYLSEGLLLVTNDGELANKLTRAAAGVEKTYLVKVSGEPSEEGLDRLRSGVAIERGKPGTGRVQTAPAQIRKVRQGDNPWYEVVIIEGRNRELRKMFEEIGHHVEKIRRVGYGPLVLDIEPGNMRELEAEELEDLRKAADGKLKPRLKDIRRKKAMDAQLPTVKPAFRRAQGTPASGEERPAEPRREFPAKKPFGGSGRGERPAGRGFQGRPGFGEKGPAPLGAQRSGPASRGAKFGTDRPAWKKDDRAGRPARPAGRFEGRPPRTERPNPVFEKSARRDRPSGGFGGTRRPEGGRPFEKKPWKKPDTDSPTFKPSAKPSARPSAGPRREFPPATDLPKPARASKLQIEAVEPEQDRPTFSRPPTGRAPFRGGAAGRPGGGREARGGRGGPGQFRPRPGGEKGPGLDRPQFGKPKFDRPRLDKPQFDRPRLDRSRGERTDSDRPGAGRGGVGERRAGGREFGEGRPARPAGDRSRPFTTSSGKPRPGGARPSNKRAAAGAPGKTAWKPKAGGAGRPATGGRSKPGFGAKPGGFSKSHPGFKGKTGGGRSGGPRAGGGSRGGGPRPGGKGPSGKKRS